MIDLDYRDLERWLIQRKRELGITGFDFLPRNDGSRRTESKRLLLRAIEECAERQPFAAPPKAPDGDSGR